MLPPSKWLLMNIVPASADSLMAAPVGVTAPSAHLHDHSDSRRSSG